MPKDLALQDLLKELYDKLANGEHEKRSGRRIKSIEKEIHYWTWQIANPNKRMNNEGVIQENCPIDNTIMERQCWNKKLGVVWQCPECSKRFVKKNNILVIYIPIKSNGRPKLSYTIS